MAAFQNLTDRLNHVFSKLRNRGALTELEIKQAMREVRVALLEADVNFTVAKDFIASVTEKAVGEEILKSLDARSAGNKNRQRATHPTAWFYAKQTWRFAQTAHNHYDVRFAGRRQNDNVRKVGVVFAKAGQKVLLCADDVYRPAAIKQLQIVAEKVKAGFLKWDRATPSRLRKMPLNLPKRTALTRSSSTQRDVCT